MKILSVLYFPFPETTPSVANTGVATSHIIGLGREITDMARLDKYKVDWKGNLSDTFNYKLQDSKDDMDANRIGRLGGSAGKSCYSVCSPYIVPGINQRYLEK